MYKILKNLMIILLSVFFINYSASASDYPNFVIMGWDGAGLRNIQLLISQERLPNLKKLIKQEEGFIILPTPLHGRTCTVPMWTEFFTGLTWDQTGSFGNEKLIGYKLESELKKYNKKNELYIGVNFWAMELPSDWCVINDLKNLGYSLGWFTSKHFVSNDCDASPLCHCAGLADDNLIVSPKSINSDSYLYILEDAAVNFISNAKQPFLVFLHVNPDYYGHKYGENSVRYLEEFERVDNILGQLIDLMIGTDTKFLIVADHGFDENKNIHANAPDAWMAGNIPFHRAYWLNDEQKAFASLIDWRPTLLEFLGIDWKDHTPMMRGKSLLDIGVTQLD